MDTVLWLCPSLPTETLKWLSSLPILMHESFWWWQCSDRYIVSLSPHLHAPFPPFSPSLISLMVSVDVKHHVYLLTLLSSVPFPPMSLQRQVVCLLLRPVFISEESLHCFLVGVQIKCYSNLWLVTLHPCFQPASRTTHPTPLHLKGKSVQNRHEVGRNRKTGEEEWEGPRSLKIEALASETNVGQDSET